MRKVKRMICTKYLKSIYNLKLGQSDNESQNIDHKKVPKSNIKYGMVILSLFGL